MSDADAARLALVPSLVQLLNRYLTNHALRQLSGRCGCAICAETRIVLAKVEAVS